MKRFDQRQGFLVSAVLHLALLMVLIAHAPVPRKPEKIDLPSPLERKDVIFLPPAAVLRQLAPPPPEPSAPPPKAAPRPAPTPPPSRKRDRISVGPPTNLRTKGPLILRREDDLTKLPEGRRDGVTATGGSSPARKAEARPAAPQAEGLRLAPGVTGTLPRGEEGARTRPRSIEGSVADAVEGIARQMQRDAQLGLPTGTGHNMGGLRFDPQGADFSVWLNRFKNEAYRNWIVPEAVFFGYHGHVELEFTVERDGSMSSLRVLRSSGTRSLDRAAESALSSSSLLPLPNDYAPPRVTMRVIFFYNEAPQGS